MGGNENGGRASQQLAGRKGFPPTQIAFTPGANFFGEMDGKLLYTLRSMAYTCRHHLHDGSQYIRGNTG